MKEISRMVRDFVLKSFYVADPGALREQDSLLNEGVVDSAGVLELVSFLEEAFGITVADEELVPGNLDSIEKIASFVERKRTGS